MYSNSKTVSSDLLNPINDQDKTLYKDVSNTIKTAIDYPPKLTLGQFSYVNCFKLAQITKKIDNFGLRVERSKNNRK